MVRLARSREFDHLVVESSGISEPAPVARLFTTESRVAALYDVNALVTVVDARQFRDAFAGEGTPERRTDPDADERPLSDLLVEQVEVSNVVLLNKADLCTDAELAEAEELIAALQPDAETIRTEFSAVDPARLLDEDRFDPDEIGDLPGWKRALADDEGDGHDEGGHDGDGHAHDEHGDHAHRHPDEVYGVTSFTYRRRRPFHPGRIAALLRDLPESVVRSKGTLWVADNDHRQVVGQAGPSVRVEAPGPWIASLPEIDRDLYRSNRPDLEWHDEHGDRLTEYVVIGTGLDREAVTEALDDCLVTDEEWERLEEGESLGADDPFPDEPGAEVALREPGA